MRIKFGIYFRAVNPSIFESARYGWIVNHTNSELKNFLDSIDVFDRVASSFRTFLYLGSFRFYFIKMSSTLMSSIVIDSSHVLVNWGNFIYGEEVSGIMQRLLLINVTDYKSLDAKNQSNSWVLGYYIRMGI